jgi:hypothetical protein
MEFMGADVGEEPPLPANILEILTEPCPFSTDGRTVAETQLLMLIPKTINGEPLNLNTLGRLFKAKFPDIGNETGCRCIWDQIKNNAKNHGKSKWVLMTRDVIEGSRNRTFREQRALIGRKGQNKYKLPLVLDAVACILLEYVRSRGQTRLYVDEPTTLTWCQEVGGFPVVVGNFGPTGLSIDLMPDYESDRIGVAAIKKF